MFNSQQLYRKIVIEFLICHSKHKKNHESTQSSASATAISAKVWNRTCLSPSYRSHVCLSVQSKANKKRYESLTNILISDFSNSAKRCRVDVHREPERAPIFCDWMKHSNKWHFHHISFFLIDKVNNSDLKRLNVQFYGHCVNLNVQFRFQSKRPISSALPRYK